MKLSNFQIFSDDNTWEPVENLECPELIEAYEKSIKPKDGVKRKAVVNGGGEAAAAVAKKKKKEETTIEKKKDTAVSL